MVKFWRLVSWVFTVGYQPGGVTWPTSLPALWVLFWLVQTAERRRSRLAKRPGGWWGWLKPWEEPRGCCLFRWFSVFFGKRWLSFGRMFPNSPTLGLGSQKNKKKLGIRFSFARERILPKEAMCLQTTNGFSLCLCSLLLLSGVTTCEFPRIPSIRRRRSFPPFYSWTVGFWVQRGSKPIRWLRRLRSLRSMRSLEVVYPYELTVCDRDSWWLTEWRDFWEVSQGEKDDGEIGWKLFYS